MCFVSIKYWIYNIRDHVVARVLYSRRDRSEYIKVDTQTRGSLRKPRAELTTTVQSLVCFFATISRFIRSISNLSFTDNITLGNSVVIIIIIISLIKAVLLNYSLIRFYQERAMWNDTDRFWARGTALWRLHGYCNSTIPLHCRLTLNRNCRTNGSIRWTVEGTKVSKVDSRLSVSSTGLSASSCLSGSRSWPVSPPGRSPGCRRTRNLQRPPESVSRRTSTSPILTETFALVRGPVDKHFRTDDVPEREEHLHEFRVTKLLRQVIDEQVASFWSRNRTSCTEHWN